LEPLQAVTKAGIRNDQTILEGAKESEEHERQGAPEENEDGKTPEEERQAAPEGEENEETPEKAEGAASPSAHPSEISDNPETELTTPLPPTPLPPPPNVFGRLILKFAAADQSLALKLHRLVGSFNARALLEDVDHIPDHAVGLALAGRNLNEEERLSTELDFVSGFHFRDKTIQIMVLEGIAEKAFSKLWSDFQRMMEDDPSFAIYYNSTFTFQKRMYATSSADLLRVSLRHDIFEFAAAPLSHARGLWRRKTFEAMQKLTGIILATKLRDVVHKDLFPSIDCLECLQGEIGTSWKWKDFAGFQTIDKESRATPAEPQSDAESSPRQESVFKMSSTEKLEARNLWLQRGAKSRSTVSAKRGSKAATKGAPWEPIPGCPSVSEWKASFRTN